MSQTEYDSEDLLQALLAKYPNLLAGEQMDSTSPRRWLLITREAAVPDQEDGSRRWLIDHLFLDQDAIPTLVEVKRSSDTRLRREVIGQMLDYAANAVLYWPMETIRAQYEANCEKQGLDPEQVLIDFLGDNDDQDSFWQKAKTNLQAGRIRMVFVADNIPSELRRVVEFLNSQMDPAEVLAVEIRQYVGQGLKTLVPRVMGQTAEAQRKKHQVSRESKQWDEQSFFKELKLKKGQDVAVTARKLLDWAKSSLNRIWWGKGAIDGSFFPMLDYNDASHSTFALWTYGRVEIQFQWMKERTPFDDESLRLKLLGLLNDIPGVDISRDSITKRPGIPLSALADEESLTKFTDAFDWVIDEMKQGQFGKEN